MENSSPFHPDARCMIDRSSTTMIHLLAKAIAASFSSPYRPFTILNKLSRHCVDPAEDLLIGTFLLESATRVYMDYHRLVAMAKESIRWLTCGLFIELVFHSNSQTVQLGYGFEPNLIPMIKQSFQSIISDWITQFDLGIIRTSNFLGYFLHAMVFDQPFQSNTCRSTISCYSIFISHRTQLNNWKQSMIVRNRSKCIKTSLFGLFVVNRLQ